MTRSGTSSEASFDATAGAPEPALALRSISKRFGAFHALRDVSLTLRPGTVHALLGENGAGKTTLMRVAFGLLSPDAGTVRLHGQAMPRTLNAARAIAGGLGMVHQHFSLVAAMTVAENVALGGHGAFAPRDTATLVRQIGERTGLHLDPDAMISDLSISAQQRCEIVKALARNARVLILDEPTAVLAPKEAQALLQWLRTFVAQSPEHAVVLITHKLRDALSIADDITVLRRGACVAHGPAHEFTEATLANTMLGPDASNAPMHEEVVPHVHQQTESVGAHHVVLAADAMCVHDARGVERVRRVSFHVRAGEIVGIAAVEGAGQAELLRAMAGLLPLHAGRRHAPADVGFVPEDRHHDALMLDASLIENLALRDAGTREGRIPWADIARRTTALLAQRDVRAVSGQVLARTLSGGNQQRFIIARALEDTPPALVIENPTRGLDFRATAAMHDALRDARDAGIAILLYSSDLDELLSLTDRVLAMHDGQLREVPRDRELVGRAMLGVS